MEFRLQFRANEMQLIALLRSTTLRKPRTYGSGLAVVKIEIERRADKSYRGRDQEVQKLLSCCHIEFRYVV